MMFESEKDLDRSKVSEPKNRVHGHSVNATVAAGPSLPLSEIARAVAEFDTQSEFPEQVSEVLMKNAIVLMEAGDYQLATNILRNLLIRTPDHGPGLRSMGVCLRELGRYEEAIKCFRALGKISSGLEAQILLAETFYLAERDVAALATYREILKQAVPERSRLFDIYKNVGNIHVRSGDFEAAEEFYNKAYNINPKSDVLMVNYGTLEIQRENFALAVERFRASVALNAENDKGWVGLALVHRQMGDLELAWANVQRALDINKKNRTAIRLVVEWSISDQRVALAVERLQEYLEADGEDAEMSFTLAKLLTVSGRLVEARIELERALALDPGIEGAEAVREALDREIVARGKLASRQKGLETV